VQRMTTTNLLLFDDMYVTFVSHCRTLSDIMVAASLAEADIRDPHVALEMPVTPQMNNQKFRRGGSVRIPPRLLACHVRH